MGSISHVVCVCMFALFFISSAHAAFRQQVFREADFFLAEGREKVTQHISTLDYADPFPPPVPARPPRPPPANIQFREADEGTEKITKHISTLDYADPFPPPVPARPPRPPPSNIQFPEAAGSHTSVNHHKTKDNMPRVDPPYSQQMMQRASIPAGGPSGSPSPGTNHV